MKMNKYKKLALNTVLFAVGSFGSKIFSLLLNNLYTKNISPSDFYVKNLLEALALFMLPVFTFSITEAVIRFGLDKKYKSEEVFSTSLMTLVTGLILMILVVPWMRFIPVFSAIGGYVILLMLYIAASAIRSVCTHFVQSRENVKLVAIDGIFTTFMLIVMSLIFVSKLQMGVRGFMISSITADISSAVFLSVMSKLWDFFSPEFFSRPLAKEMLRFTAPLIPTVMMWSITELSDQLFIGNMKSDSVFLGAAAAGLYAAATKLPNLLAMVSTIFFKAWNMSAIMENGSADRNKFYERVYGAYESVMFIGSAALIMLVKPISAILINYNTFPEYKAVYLYTPLLISAAVFNCLDQFLFGIYTATGHTKNAFATTFVTCIFNLILNSIMIPMFGINGAAGATFLSYLLCYAVRMIDARYYVPFRFSPKKTLLNTLAVLAMSFVVMSEVRFRFIFAALIMLPVLALNAGQLFVTAKKLLKK